MKPAILMYYYDARSLVAAVTAPVANRVASKLGWDCLVITNPPFPEPYMAKAHLISELLPARPRILYLDADAIFTGASVEEVEKLFLGNDLNLSVDTSGFCTGVMGVWNTQATRRLFSVWSNLGVRIDAGNLFDQSTFVLLFEHFQWVKNCVTPVPVEVVSNPSCAPIVGSAVHHQWCRCYDQKIVAENLQAIANRSRYDT